MPRIFVHQRMIPVLIAIAVVVVLAAGLPAGAIQRARCAEKLHPRIVERRGRGIEAPLRPHSEPRCHGERLCRARTRGAGARDRTAQPLRRQQRPGRRPVTRRSPVRGRAQAIARRRGKLSAFKADQNFLQLQKELVNTEDRIQAARRFYNGNVRDYRNKCETFPSNLVANLFGFKSEGDFFSVPPSVQEVPNVDFAATYSISH